jgi:hypothetical protein
MGWGGGGAFLGFIELRPSVYEYKCVDSDMEPTQVLYAQPRKNTREEKGLQQLHYNVANSFSRSLQDATILGLSSMSYIFIVLAPFLPLPSLSVRVPPFFILYS